MAVFLAHVTLFRNWRRDGGSTVTSLKETVLPDFFKSFWVRRMALDKRNYKQVVETTVDLGNKVGVGEIVERIVNNLKDESEAYRKMTVETIEKVISAMGAADINERLEERLVDGILHAFQEQSVEDIVLLNGFGTIVNALGARCKPYLPQIVSTILWRLNNKSPTVRQQAADLVTRIAVVLKQCGEDGLIVKLGTILYEQLGEEYPEVLGSVLGAMRSIVTVVGISQMQPPIRDVLPRLTPILRNSASSFKRLSGSRASSSVAVAPATRLRDLMSWAAARPESAIMPRLCRV